MPLLVIKIFRGWNREKVEFPSVTPRQRWVRRYQRRGWERRRDEQSAEGALSLGSSRPDGSGAALRRGCGPPSPRPSCGRHRRHCEPQVLLFSWTSARILGT